MKTKSPFFTKFNHGVEKRNETHIIKDFDDFSDWFMKENPEYVRFEILTCGQKFSSVPPVSFHGDGQAIGFFKDFTVSSLIGGCATWNADPFEIGEDDAKEIIDNIKNYGVYIITDKDELKIARNQLEMSNDDNRTIFQSGTGENRCIFII